jgi:hypothetical protein
MSSENITKYATHVLIQYNAVFGCTELISEIELNRNSKSKLERN